MRKRGHFYLRTTALAGEIDSPPPRPYIQGESALCRAEGKAEMAENEPLFDPYHRWLGIQPKDQPPNHYRLLGVDLFESDAEVIEDAAMQRIAHVRSYQLGRHVEMSQKILNELAAAKVCLLNAEKRAAYDAELRNQRNPPAPPAIPPAIPPAAPPPLPPPQPGVRPLRLAHAGMAIAACVLVSAIGLSMYGLSNRRSARQTAAVSHVAEKIGLAARPAPAPALPAGEKRAAEKPSTTTPAESKETSAAAPSGGNVAAGRTGDVEAVQAAPPGPSTFVPPVASAIAKRPGRECRRRPPPPSLKTRPRASKTTRRNRRSLPRQASRPVAMRRARRRRKARARGRAAKRTRWRSRPRRCRESRPPACRHLPPRRSNCAAASS